MAVKTFYFFGSYGSFRPFIMEVESGSDGVFIIPRTGSGYNYYVKTSDGQTFGGVTGNLTITFPSPNTRYDVEIYGLFPKFYFNNGGQRLKIKDIKQWGDIVWGASQTNAFNGCANLQVSATDVPNLSNVTSLHYMFYNATSLNLDVDFTSSYNNTNLTSFASRVRTIQNVKLDCSSVNQTGGAAGNLQPFYPYSDSSNANIELHNLSVSIWLSVAANLTSGVTFYNMILTFDHSASATITMTTIQKNNLLSYLQSNVNPAYTTLQDWLTDIGSNWTIA